MKFLVEFIDNFIEPQGEITFFHVITAEKITVSPVLWRRAMSTISTTYFLSGTDGLCINYRVKNADSVAAGIIAEANSNKYDLLLLANSTYRKRLKHLFGNKVDEVIRSSAIESVVLSYFDDRPLEYRKILIPTSGFQHSVRAAKMAEVLAKKHNSDITVLFVGNRHEDAHDALKPVTRSLDAAGARYRALFRKGPVVETIIDEADKGYDMMMIGATERSVYQQFLLGSTADKLIKNSPCPVIMLKTEKNSDE